MIERIERLEWDSEFFGVPIGRVSLDGVDAATLAAIDGEARDKGIECLYGSLTASTGTIGYLVQEHGHRLVEVNLTFGRPAGPFTAKPTESVCRRGTVDDLALLEEPIAELAPWSRFATDPRFGSDAAFRMHTAWVARAARDDDRMLAITENERGVSGISTQVRNPVPRVDLMGVVQQGSGASWALMNELVDWAGPVDIEAGPCAARNIAPLRFLEHCGFAMVRSAYTFHRWLDER